jgi:hypothetical protein
MPHYFFHLTHADWRVEDPEGADFDAPAAAVQEASAALRDLIAAALIGGMPSTLQAVEVTDVDGVILATIDIIDATAPVFDFTSVGAQRKM